MAEPSSIDGVLVQWGDRLFYPGDRVVRPRREPRLRQRGLTERAAAIRKRIEATVVRRAPQVMVKVTGGGRGMKAIAAHLRYISKNGRLDIEDDRGQVARGKDTVHDLVEEWRFSGGYIADTSERREAFNIMLSMPRGSAETSIVQRAAREFAQAELADHKYVMVLHDHQANPHVHISVRAESRHGRRLNPRKADLHRWRETFAEKLRGRGIDAEATRQATRGASRNHPDLWRLKRAEDGRLLKPRREHRRGRAVVANRAEARRAWQEIATVLAKSSDAADRALVESIARFARAPGLDRDQASRAVNARVPEAATRTMDGPSR
jgi:hypothetical protein